MPTTGKRSERITTPEFQVKKNGRPRGRKTAGRAHVKRPPAMEREFIAWDCEGYSPDNLDYVPQEICLFGNSNLEYITGEGIPTKDCLKLICETGRMNPTAMHVAFAFGYDVNMICRDIPKFLLLKLFAGEVIFWEDYRIEYIPKKWFQVTQMFGVRTTVRIQDVFSFFGCSFVAALSSWDVCNADELAFIAAGKAQRSTFTLDALDETILPYWSSEIVLLRTLCERLRSVLHSGGFDIQDWYGPGCIANYVFKQRGMKQCMDRELPDEILSASQFAYAGGRFELLRAGLYDGDVYTADINSAYPYAMSLMPNLARGYWHFTTSIDEIAETARGYFNSFSGQRCNGPRMAMVDCTYELGKGARNHDSQVGWPYPGVHRNKLGQILYPFRNSTWMHLPEFSVIQHLSDTEPNAFAELAIHGAWIFYDDGSYPFDWVSELYSQRAAWKRAGNPAQLAAKLAINSLYGKMAQRVGGKDGKIPTWHQLEYAGHITSHCRAQVWLAGERWQHGVFAFETDGVFSTTPFPGLSTGEGDGLGQWKVEHYTGVLYLQSGVYWLRDENGDWKPPKARGVPRAQLRIEEAMTCLDTGLPLQVESYTFAGFNVASKQRNKKWRTWVTEPKEFSFGGTGKRNHLPVFCKNCPTQLNMHVDQFAPGLHNLTARFPTREQMRSSPHKLPWRGGTYPGMLEMMLNVDAETDDPSDM